jgi:hypothetical protein
LGSLGSRPSVYLATPPLQRRPGETEDEVAHRDEEQDGEDRGVVQVFHCS